MSKKIILRLALPTPLCRFFDYFPPQSFDLKALIPGIRVRVPFQSRILVGILIEIVKESSVPLQKIKHALELLDKEPIFSKEVYQLCQWAANYYHYSFGEILASALPTLLRKGKPAKANESHLPVINVMDPQLDLNTAQQQAVQEIIAQKNKFCAFLLDGVTGSGKTEVYLRTIFEVLKEDKQILVLVPEISLTPQTIERFRARFPVSIVALHSGLSEQERLKGWLSARCGVAKIVIGTRSAIFTPFAKLGLIIVDEEHDTSFKQQDRFRYHARDLAIMRASINQIPIVLGSATPSLESLLNVKRNRYTYLSLPERAGIAKLPQYQILDLRHVPCQEGLSEPLLKNMQVHIQQGNQVMLFLNKRGFAPVLYCTQCHFIVGCERCATRMVYHRKPPRLQCHHCDAHREIPVCCAECGAPSLQPVGLGTQRIEQTLEKLFPEVPIIRMDRDSTKRKGSMQDLLQQINTQQKAILLGTQMLAKGHHFPHVTLVGIIDADSGLFSADFRAMEQMGQLLLQVAGRAGRAEKPGTVMIQTQNPDHPLLKILINHGYLSFAQLLLKEREQAFLPPYSYFAILRAEAHKEQNAHRFLTLVKEQCDSVNHTSVMMLGPVPPLLAKRKGMYCQHLLIKANQRRILQNFLKTIIQKIEKLPESLPVRWVLDVDPVEV